MKKSLIPLLLVILLATLTIATTSKAVTYEKGMKPKQINAAVEKAVLDFQYECWWICGDNSVRVTKGADGQYHTAGGEIIKETDVHCFGKRPVDKVARAQRTADEAKIAANSVKADVKSIKADVKKAKSTADEALALARKAGQQAAIDSLARMISVLQLSYNELHIDINELRTENGQQDTELDILAREMPADQSEAIAGILLQVYDLEEMDQRLEAFARVKGNKAWEKICARAEELKAAENNPELGIETPPSVDVVKPHRKWPWSR